MENDGKKEIQRSKPDNMSVEQWEDYKHMCANPGKSYSTMTGSRYEPSKEERAYYKKWTPKEEKYRKNKRTIDKLIFLSIIIIGFLVLFSR